MNTLEAIQQRRSVKHYDANHQMSDDEVKTLMEHVILSPTSFNMQNWRFVLVRDPELRKQVRAAAWDQAQVTDASLLIILCANLNSWQTPEKYFTTAPDAVRDMLQPMIPKFYEGKEQLQRDEAMRSCGIAGQTIMLGAKAMGYDSCPMIGFDSAGVAKVINLPDDHAIGFIVVVGKATKPAWPRLGQLSMDEVVIEDKFA